MSRALNSQTTDDFFRLLTLFPVLLDWAMGNIQLMQPQRSINIGRKNTLKLRNFKKFNLFINSASFLHFSYLIEHCNWRKKIVNVRISKQN